MSVVGLMNPDDLDPDETHAHGLDTEIRVGENWGTVFDRGYTLPGNKPVYAFKCDDNMERSVIESNIDEVRKA